MLLRPAAEPLLRLTIENQATPADQQPLTKTLGREGLLRIGRDDSADWTLADRSGGISRNHCMIRCVDGVFVVQDTSSNGTFVNDDSERIRGSHTLRDGDRLLIGPYLITARITGIVNAAAIGATGPGIDQPAVLSAAAEPPPCSGGSSASCRRGAARRRPGITTRRSATGHPDARRPWRRHDARESCCGQRRHDPSGAGGQDTAADAVHRSGSDHGGSGSRRCRLFVLSCCRRRTSTGAAARPRIGRHGQGTRAVAGGPRRNRCRRAGRTTGTTDLADHRGNAAMAGLAQCRHRPAARRARRPQQSAQHHAEQRGSAARAVRPAPAGLPGQPPVFPDLPGRTGPALPADGCRRPGRCAGTGKRTGTRGHRPGRVGRESHRPIARFAQSQAVGHLCRTLGQPQTLAATPTGSLLHRGLRRRNDS
ncbi:FHA domain-containing protein [Candidatus Accumulibacter phosphatis]|uniref:FHA domain-containing protein n=1 Tax=Candidatus Accumulibacter contiguus TaxID=2954381 RepID=A0ABX1T8V0_9PROT|nr:FHA domain-containing protein [Candidatus Accumulibacter contiguus]